jgi:hypothetical protein
MMITPIWVRDIALGHVLDEALYPEIIVPVAKNYILEYNLSKKNLSCTILDSIIETETERFEDSIIELNEIKPTVDFSNYKLCFIAIQDNITSSAIKEAYISSPGRGYSHLMEYYKFCYAPMSWTRANCYELFVCGSLVSIETMKELIYIPVNYGELLSIFEHG